MVLVVEDWDMFLEHLGASRGIGLFQVSQTGEGVQLRVRGGTLGYEEEFDGEDDPKLAKRLKVLEAKGVIKVKKIVQDEAWFI